MKLNISMFRKLLLLLVMVCSFTITQAQEKVVSGTVTDANDGMGIPGVSVVVKGTTTGTSTDFDGHFSISADASSTLVFSFIGYKSQEIPVGDQTNLNIALATNTENLSEVVVIGYGQVKKEDATGSVIAIKSDDFNKGSISSPQELLTGKMPGVTITSGGGAPGAGSTIRIRGGSSLSASNDPLIIIDGVPVSSDAVSGMRNPLNTINPNDIATFTVLKDASATAIYGSRASNGVILVTTKKGKKGQDFKVNYSGNVSVNTVAKQINLLNTEELGEVIQQYYPDKINLLGTENTDWQKEIFETSISHDHNINFSGSEYNTPYRVSIGYTDQEGILKTSSLERYTGALTLNPTFFDDHLKVNINAKGLYIKNRFADTGAIGGALAFDPSRPVKSDDTKYDKYGNYYTYFNGDVRDVLAPTNPLALLNQKRDESEVKRFIGNTQFDYKFHFLPELRANLNVAYDYSKSEGDIIEDAEAAWTESSNGNGSRKVYSQEKKNELVEFYLNYKKDFDQFDSKIDLVGGYSWQHFWREDANSATTTFDQSFEKSPASQSGTENYLVSFFGRMNYTFKDRYLLTFTLRQDGSSRFSKDNRWGLFPSAAFAWRMNEELFLKKFEKLSNLKLRLGYGVTGQQEIGQGDYPYQGIYNIGNDQARYQFGDTYYNTIRPNAYDADIKWEETTTYNIGLDFGFFNNRLNGSVDAYKRKTKDLINEIDVAAGSNLKNRVVTNIGSLENEGLEISLNGIIVSNDDWNWELNANAAYNKNEITKLTDSNDPNFKGVFTGGISGGTGNNIQIHSTGHAANAFYVYQQMYDVNGKPLEGVYVDRNNDGQITLEGDRYIYQKPSADWTFGFGSNLGYKKWTLSMNARLSLGNYVYNNIESDKGHFEGVVSSLNNITNRVANANDAKFFTAQYHSDYFIQDASFFKLDNVTLGYDLGKVCQDKLNIYLYTTVQNVFTITDYKGLDPEIFGGIDNNIYPRPRTFLLGVNVNF
ncbi:iron complex outermembrane receptor protein [Ancylomarina subtilis]|uniref:Iron complex outermembrane receptor protein n=1 Tax=Ancylomarina subtilis TaxID=1639035 RepID=A0A4Q7VAR7_9BACT|nr:TonB-dependent receptor [Ancylomarina subtilis]RZT91842.1 iron complex outermembrane receptor protein [Ancylomarina subtilis]